MNSFNDSGESRYRQLSYEPFGFRVILTPVSQKPTIVSPFAPRVFGKTWRCVRDFISSLAPQTPWIPIS